MWQEYPLDVHVSSGTGFWPFENKPLTDLYNLIGILSYFLQLRLRLRYFVLVWNYLWSQCAGTLGAHHFTRHGNSGGHLLQDYPLLEHIQLVCVAGDEWHPWKILSTGDKTCVCLFRNMFCIYTFIISHGLWHVAAVVVIFVEYLVLFVAAVAFNIEWSWKWPRVIIHHHELPSKRPWFFFEMCVYIYMLVWLTVVTWLFFFRCELSTFEETVQNGSCNLAH